MINTNVTKLACAWQSAATLCFLSHTQKHTHTQSAYNHTHTQNSQPHMQGEYSNFMHLWMCVSLPSGFCNCLYIGFSCCFLFVCFGQKQSKGELKSQVPSSLLKKTETGWFVTHLTLCHTFQSCSWCYWYSNSWAKNGSSPGYILCNFLTSVFNKLDQKYGEKVSCVFFLEDGGGRGL